MTNYTTNSVSGKLVATRKNNPCPVCEDTSGKCRNHPSGSVLCMPGSSGQLAGNGYRFVKATKDHLWGIYAPEGQKEHRIAPLLPREEKTPSRPRKGVDALNRQSLGRLRLNDAHLKNLQSRGLTNDQIASYGYKSDYGGYLIPVYDIQGLLIGLQKRLDKPLDGNRYLWHSFDCQDKNTASGELPVGVHGDRERGNTIHVCEGFLKAHIAHCKHGGPWLGFGSVAQLTSSRKEIKRTFRVLQPSKVIFAPDAGCLVNRDVMRAYRSALRDWQEWGYQVEIAWWGQGESKEHPDIDELLPQEQLPTIPVDEFLSLDQTCGESPGDYWTELKDTVEGLSAAITDRSKPLQRCDLKVDGTDLSRVKMPQSGIVAVKMPCGTGKTEWVKKHLEGMDDHCAYITHRQSLARASGYPSLNESDRGEGEILINGEPVRKVSLCIDSLLALPDKYNVLIIDEFTQVLKHLLTSSTLRKNTKRGKVISKFKELVKNAELIIILDADMTGDAISLIESIRSERAFIIEGSTHRMRYPLDVYLNIPSMEDSLVQALRRGEKTFISCDTKVCAKRWEWICNRMGIKSLLVTSETSGDESLRDVLKDIDRYLLTSDIQAFIASPSIDCGFSVKEDYFDSVWGFFTGASINPRATYQALCRIRSDARRHVYYAEHGRNYSSLGVESNPSDLHNNLTRNVLTQRHLLGSYYGIGTIDWGSAENQYLFQSEAQGNRETRNFRSYCLAGLYAAGHRVAPGAKGDGCSKGLMAEARKTVRELGLQEIFDAQKLTDEDFQHLKDLTYTKPEDSLALKRYRMCDFYRIDPEALTLEDIAMDTPSARAGVMRLQAYLYPGGVGQTEIDQIARHGTNITPQDLTHHTASGQFLREIGIDHFLQEGQAWDKNDRAAQDFADRLLSRYDECKRLLSFDPRNKKVVSIVGHVLLSMGLKTVSQQVRVGKDRIRRYQLDLDTLSRLQGVVSRRNKNLASKESQRVTLPVNRTLLKGGVTTSPPPRLMRWQKRPGELWVVEEVDSEGDYTLRSQDNRKIFRNVDGSDLKQAC